MIDASLPARASVVVVGGGAMGCSTLYHLAKAGVGDAVLLERNQLTSGTTWHSAAQVRALRSTQSLTNLIKYSVELYTRLERETGQISGWINKGSLSIATTPDRLTHIRRQIGLARLYGVAAEEISPAEAAERWPHMRADDVIGAAFSPGDGRVSPSDLCAALAKGARARGARIFESTPVSGIETEGGRVRAVLTAAGRIACDAVAICAGLWSREAAAMAGALAPVWPCEHFYLLTRPIEGIEGNLPTLADHDAHLYIRDDSGGLLVGCFEPMGKPLEPARLGPDFAFQLLPEDWDHFEPMMANALHRLPPLESAEVKMLLNGPESFTPDSAFLLGEAAETRGLYLGCGMNSMGVASAGGAGWALAETIANGAPPVDLSEVDPKRFPECWNSAAALAARAPEVLGRHYEISYPARQMDSARNLRRGPLDAAHHAADAWFGQVYGWERPLCFARSRFAPDGPPRLTFGRPDWFDQVGGEVDAAHRRTALFDLSSFGKIRVEGADAERFLNRVCANDMTREPGRVIYTAMLNARGGFESDLTAVRLWTDSFRLMVGSGAVKRDLAWLRAHLEPDERVTLSDETEAYAVIGLMGPEARLLAARARGAWLSVLRRFDHGEGTVAGVAVRAARLSYVGEDGWELTLAAADAPALWAALREAGAEPAGLFAQTAMRIEKRFLAMGHDLDADITPLEAGLEFAVDWRSDFIGRAALEQRRASPPAKRVASLICADAEAVPLGGEPVYRGDEIVGKTSSAAFGHRIGRPVALALLRADCAESAELAIDIAGRRWPARAQAGPAYEPAR